MAVRIGLDCGAVRVGREGFKSGNGQSHAVPSGWQQQLMWCGRVREGGKAAAAMCVRQIPRFGGETDCVINDAQQRFSVDEAQDVSKCYFIRMCKEREGAGRWEGSSSNLG